MEESVSNPKRRISRVAVSAVLAAATATVIISSTSKSGESGQAQTVKSHGQDLVAESSADSDDPTTWQLPIEAYLPDTSRAGSLVASARDARIDECMADAGLPEWEPAPDLPSLENNSFTGTRYGRSDIEQARKSGYHPDPEKVAAYNKALREDHSMETDREVLKKCAFKVDGRPSEEMDAARQPSMAEEIAYYSYRDSMNDSRVLRAFKRWSECMKTKGYNYEAPMDANDDPQWAANGGFTQKEIDTAVADVECRDKYHVERVWFDSEAEIQNSMIGKNLKVLQQERVAAQGRHQ